MRRSRELREMRERRAREEAEKKVVVERQARENAEKRAKVERARMTRAEAKRKSIAEAERRTQLQAVQRKEETDLLRKQQESARKRDELKTLEATERRRREKLERKERRLREDAERRAERERQARLEAEQKIKLLEAQQAAEVSKRKQAEAACRRQQREHEEAVRKANASIQARKALEKQLSALKMSAPAVPQNESFAIQASDKKHFSEEAELIRSSYYVQHLKLLASRELLRDNDSSTHDSSATNRCATQTVDKQELSDCQISNNITPDRTLEQSNATQPTQEQRTGVAVKNSESHSKTLETNTSCAAVDPDKSTDANTQQTKEIADVSFKVERLLTLREELLSKSPFYLESIQHAASQEVHHRLQKPLYTNKVIQVQPDKQTSVIDECVNDVVNGCIGSIISNWRSDPNAEETLQQRDTTLDSVDQQMQDLPSVRSRTYGKMYEKPWKISDLQSATQKSHVSPKRNSRRRKPLHASHERLNSRPLVDKMRHMRRVDNRRNHRGHRRRGSRGKHVDPLNQTAPAISSRKQAQIQK